MHPSRRHFLASLGLLAAGAGCQTSRRTAQAHSHRILFTSGGKTWQIRPDGSGLKSFEFSVPNQATWQPGPAFPDGQRLIFLSMEPRRDGPGRPFDEYYSQTPTHLWIYDFRTEQLTEIAHRERRAVFYTPQLLLGQDRLLVQVVEGKVGQVLNIQLDGSDAIEFTRKGEGLPYGFSLSPDGRRVAYHLASPEGYQIWTSNPEGQERIKVAGHRDHLYFGPAWSPDGQWLVFQDCDFRNDPAHDWSDLCVCRPDGRDLRRVTSGQAQWFGSAYGNPQHRGSGSNMPVWTRDQRILFSRKRPGSKVAWEFQAQQRDVDHFNRAWKPDLARGGTDLCLLDPHTMAVQPLTQSEPPVWDFRGVGSPDGEWVAFCRCAAFAVPALWVMRSDGRDARELTRGADAAGADHPRWL